jgi:hypothetical protein
MQERTHNMVVRVTEVELARVHAVARDRGEAIAVVFRRWLNDTYHARFGAAEPPKPKLKHDLSKKTTSK